MAGNFRKGVHTPFVAILNHRKRADFVVSLMRILPRIGSNSVAPQTARAAGRNLGPILAVMAALMTATLAAHIFLRATMPWAAAPDNDYWGNITGLITGAGVQLDIAELLQHSNEHIVAVPKLLYAANYALTSGSNVGLLVYSLFTAAACVGLLLYLARDLLCDRPWRFGVCGLLFPLAMFSPRLAHSYFLAMSGTAWLTADLFVILCAIAFGRMVATGSTLWLLSTLLAALLATATFTTGLYALVVFLLFCLAALFIVRLRAGLPVPWLLASAAIAAAAITLVLINRRHPGYHPALSFDVPRLIAFVLTYIGSAVAERPLQLAAGAGVLALGIASIMRLTAQGHLKDIAPWVVLFAFAPFNAALTGVGRLGFGMAVAESGRYQPVMALTLIATLALALLALPRTPLRTGWFGRSVAVALLLLGAGIGASYSTALDRQRDRNGRKALAEIAMRQGIVAEHHLEAMTPAAPQLAEFVPTLRAARHVPFTGGSRCEELIGERLPDSPQGRPSGYLDTISTYEPLGEHRQALELSGWAERDGRPAECIAIVDGDRIAIGAGTPVYRRPDVDRHKGRALGYVGWQAVATMPQSWPVCAFALFPDSKQWVPLLKCKESVHIRRHLKDDHP